jgi:hypothetical protein
MTTSGVYTASGFNNNSFTPNDVANGPDGNLWLVGWQGSGYPVFAARVLVSDGSATYYQLPDSPTNFLGGVSAGADGGVWIPIGDPYYEIVRIDPVTGTITKYSISSNFDVDGPKIVSGPNRLLYFHAYKDAIMEFDPFTKRITGHITTANTQCGKTFAGGSDGQLWVTGSAEMCVYLLHPIVPVPASITVSVGASTGLTVSEPKSFQKNFTVVSNNPNIATVTGSGMSFTVYGVSVGSTTLTVSDKVENSLAVPVTVQ